jgi:hypothetical protein
MKLVTFQAVSKAGSARADARRVERGRRIDAVFILAAWMFECA